MAHRIEHSRDYPVPADELLRAVTAPEYQVLRETSQGAIKASVRELSRTDARLVYEVDITNYARGMTGVDKSKTERAVATYTWDLEAGRGDWTYKTVHGDRVKIWGTLRVLEAGAGSRLTSEINLDVKIPLMGRRIEKMIAAGINEGRPTFDKTLQDFVSRGAS